MAIAWLRGSQRPTSAELTTLKAQTIGNSTRNELEIILEELNFKPGTGSSPANQPTISTLLP